MRLQMSFGSMTVGAVAFTISTDVLAHFFGLTLVVNKQAKCGTCNKQISNLNFVSTFV